MSTMMCPNCEQQWLFLINGTWRHQYSDASYACWDKQAVEAGTPYVEPTSESNDTMKYLLELLA